MKDYCLELVAAQKSSTTKYNAMREYLQAYILRIMHNRGAFQSTAFVGGTALRFLYDLPRFSEDLDFSSYKNPDMPFVNLKIVGKLNKEQKARIAQEFSDTLLRVAGKPKEATYLVIDEVAGENWAQGEHFFA